MKAKEQRAEEASNPAAGIEVVEGADALDQLPVEREDNLSGLPGQITLNASELAAVSEALIFVADEPINARTISEVLRIGQDQVQVAIEQLAEEFNARNGGLHLREIAGGWQLATRPESRLRQRNERPKRIGAPPNARQSASWRKHANAPGPPARPRRDCGSWRNEPRMPRHSPKQRGKRSRPRAWLSTGSAADLTAGHIGKRARDSGPAPQVT